LGRTREGYGCSIVGENPGVTNLSTSMASGMTCDRNINRLVTFRDGPLQFRGQIQIRFEYVDRVEAVFKQFARGDIV
jgi:hypothetical protein